MYWRNNKLEEIKKQVELTIGSSPRTFRRCNWTPDSTSNATLRCMEIILHWLNSNAQENWLCGRLDFCFANYRMMKMNPHQVQHWILWVIQVSHGCPVLTAIGTQRIISERWWLSSGGVYIHMTRFGEVFTLPPLIWVDSTRTLRQF